MGKQTFCGNIRSQANCQAKGLSCICIRYSWVVSFFFAFDW